MTSPSRTARGSLAAILLSAIIGLPAAASAEEAAPAAEPSSAPAADVADAAEAAEAALPPIQLHGYHETHANIVIDGEHIVDPHRTVLGLEARLSERILFSFELDFEHAFEEPELEFAEVIGHLSDSWDVVAGTMLMPFGSLNETHEPPFFYSVERPFFQRDYIPTSWQDVGVGFRASFVEGSVRLRGGVVNGLSAFAITEDGVRLKESIREMKQKARFASFLDMAGVLRAEWTPTLWLKLGASAYGGGADQRREDSLQVQIAMSEIDARIRTRGIEVRLEGGLGVLTGEYFYDRGVDGPMQAAALVEIAWHQALPQDQELVPFARFEYVDPDADGAGHTAFLAYTAGLAWYPIPQVAVKADFVRLTHRDPRAYNLESGPDGELNQINLGIGLLYP